VIRTVATALTVAAVAIAVSLLLVPRGEELALMHFKDRAFEEAERLYRLELSRRGMQPNLVVPLNALRLRAGRIEEAVGLLERFSEQHPDDVQAFEMLADLYRQAQRPRDRVEALRRLAELEPTTGRLRALAEWYDYLERPAERRDLLRRLAERGAASAEEIETLAHLEAAAGDLGAAEAVLAQLWGRDPAAIDEQRLLLHAALLLDTNRAAQAAELGSRWREAGRAAGPVLELARLLEGRGRLELALELAQAVDGEAAASDEALGLRSGLAVRLGRSRSVLDALLARERRGGMPGELRLQLVEAALASREPALALAHAAQLAPAELPQWMLPGLVEAALATDRAQMARELFSRIDERVLASRPLFAAQTAFAVSDEQAARRWASAAQGALASDGERAELALLHRALGDDARARALLLAVRLDNVQGALRTDLVNLYLALGEAQRGLAALEAAGDRASGAWALLGTATGNEQGVMDWLTARPDPAIGEGLANDLYWLARQQGLERLRAALAGHGAQRFASPEWQLRLARVRLDQGRAPEALALLRALRDELEAAAELYPQALMAAAAQDPDAARELEDYVAARIERDGVEAPGIEQLVYDLLAAGAARAALPALERLADTGAGWFHTYLETLEQLGEREAVAGAIARRLETATLEREERLGLLLRLAESGAVDAALDALERRALADHAAEPFWLYAYEEAAMRFDRVPRLVAFLRRAAFEPSAPRAVREARTYMLLAQLTAPEALPVLARLAKADPQTWDGAYRERLLQAGRHDELARHLAARARDAPPQQARELAFALLELGRREMAEETFARLAAREGPQSDAMRQLLFLWGPRPGARAGDWLAARAEAAKGPDRAGWARHLVAVGGADRAAALLRLSALEGNDAGSAAAYLEALLATGDRAALRRELDRLLAATGEPSSLRRIARLAAEHGQPQVAAQAWSRLLAAAPRDREALRALGLTSYQLGQWRRAAELLARLLDSGAGDYEAHYFLAESLAALGRRQRAAVHFEAAVRQVDAARSPDFRMRTVRAQSLHRLGHTRAAARAYEALLAERPAEGHLRADYGDMLLDSGDLARAASVLR